MSRPGGRWTRVAIGARALLATGLAVVAALLAVEVSDWRYVRLDLTENRSNTLDPAVLDVIDRLPEPIVVDVFLRRLKPPYLAVSLEVEQRLLGFLSTVHNARRGKVEVTVHGTSDFEAVRERQRELRTEGTNKVVVSCGQRRDELEVFGELFSVDWGHPSRQGLEYLAREGIPDVVTPRWNPMGAYVPASLQAFRGEELFVEALLKVSSGETPRVYFVKGHGEPSLENSEATDLSTLSGILERDGFEVLEWDPLTTPSVPADCAVLALVGAGQRAQPYQPATRETIVAWARGGGRILAAPGLEEVQEGSEGGITDILREFGVLVRPGVVCQPLVGLGGEKVDGNERCAWLVIDERGLQPGHPLTEPLRNRGRRVQFTFSPSLETAGFDPESGVMLPLVSSQSDSWRDVAPFDFRFNPAQGESRGRHTLVAAKQLRATKDTEGTVHQGRVLAVASSYFFGNDSIGVNRDFALLAFNWLAERDYRMAVSSLERSESYLDFERGNARPALFYTLWLGLPGLCALVGAGVFLRRRS